MVRNRPINCVNKWSQSLLWIMRLCVETELWELSDHTRINSFQEILTILKIFWNSSYMGYTNNIFLHAHVKAYYFLGGWQTVASAINSEKACLKMTLTRLDSECPFERSQKNVAFQTFLIVGSLVSKPWKIALFHTKSKRLADCNCI